MKTLYRFLEKHLMDKNLLSLLSEEEKNSDILNSKVNYEKIEKDRVLSINITRQNSCKSFLINLDLDTGKIENKPYTFDITTTIDYDFLMHKVMNSLSNGFLLKINHEKSSQIFNTKSILDGVRKSNFKYKDEFIKHQKIIIKDIFQFIEKHEPEKFKLLKFIFASYKVSFDLSKNNTFFVFLRHGLSFDRYELERLIKFRSLFSYPFLYGLKDIREIFKNTNHMKDVEFLNHFAKFITDKDYHFTKRHVKFFINKTTPYTFQMEGYDSIYSIKRKSGNLFDLIEHKTNEELNSVNKKIIWSVLNLEKIKINKNKIFKSHVVKRKSLKFLHKFQNEIHDYYDFISKFMDEVVEIEDIDLLKSESDFYHKNIFQIEAILESAKIEHFDNFIIPELLEEQIFIFKNRNYNLKQLRSYKEYHMTGKKLKNCIISYWRLSVSGNSILYSITESNTNHHSVIEYVFNGKEFQIRQHEESGNHQNKDKNANLIAHKVKKQLNVKYAKGWSLFRSKYFINSYNHDNDNIYKECSNLFKDNHIFRKMTIIKNNLNLT